MNDATPSTTALQKWGPNQVAVRIDGGFMVRAERRIRLFFGTELYSACKGTPGPLEKVSLQQPGYMKLTAAMGATLTVPPSIQDPVTRQPMANPVVEFVPGTSVIRSVRATAVCVARDAMGVYHGSVQTITVDAEAVLRQALLKIEREEIVQILSDEDVIADKKEGKLRGFVVVPFMPGYSLVGKASAQPIREALQTYNNLSATIRQRACTKAERLACDHNPVTRMTWLYGELWQDIVSQKDGTMDRRMVEDGIPQGWEKAGPSYVEIDVTSWAESRGQAAIDEFVQSLASQQQVDGVETVVGETADAEDSEIDDEPEDPVVRQIAQSPIPPQVIQAAPPKPEPVPVTVATPVATPVVAPAETVVAPVVEASPEVQKLREQCLAFLADLPEAEIKFSRNKSGFGDRDVSTCIDVPLLRRFRTELSESSKAIR